MKRRGANLYVKSASLSVSRAENLAESIQAVNTLLFDLGNILSVLSICAKFLRNNTHALIGKCVSRRKAVDKKEKKKKSTATNKRLNYARHSSPSTNIWRPRYAIGYLSSVFISSLKRKSLLYREFVSVELNSSTILYPLSTRHSAWFTHSLRKECNRQRNPYLCIQWRRCKRIHGAISDCTWHRTDTAMSRMRSRWVSRRGWRWIRQGRNRRTKACHRRCFPSPCTSRRSGTVAPCDTGSDVGSTRPRTSTCICNNVQNQHQFGERRGNFFSLRCILTYLFVYFSFLYFLTMSCWTEAAFFAAIFEDFLLKMNKTNGRQFGLIFRLISNFSKDFCFFNFRRWTRRRKTVGINF